ncbi:hypothetical protein F5984_22290 [Rudanella paleaurantiibacter]|uniref:TonB C-terminal domain-containing protein n=1 Tax=Rudanella paleaurantiibacter TaxID=2614655 RepID=A0A7J5TU01_9BACT|nr:hypothetical protein [Rudanella paleaurantiibacter]KAB7727356.1 hypothetical protein F5984_22290 [Rudanella paleaurantiibacter]
MNVYRLLFLVMFYIGSMANLQAQTKPAAVLDTTAFVKSTHTLIWHNFGKLSRPIMSKMYDSPRGFEGLVFIRFDVNGVGQAENNRLSRAINPQFEAALEKAITESFSQLQRHSVAVLHGCYLLPLFVSISRSKPIYEPESQSEFNVLYNRELFVNCILFPSNTVAYAR